MNFPLFPWGAFQIITEPQIVFLPFILHFPIYFGINIPTNQPSESETYCYSVQNKTESSFSMYRSLTGQVMWMLLF